jgi:hypothetical protein
MKLTAILLSIALTVSGGVVCAQSASPGGRGSTTGDPAASSATPGTTNHGQFDESEPKRERYVGWQRRQR